MQRKAVNSSDLASVGYDELTKILEIEFHNGGVYQYHGVPEHIHANLMRAGSKGMYFNQFIKNSFQFTKL